MEPNISSGIAYTLNDLFENNDFNMVYVQAIPDWEIKIRQKYLELMERANPKLSKDDLFKLKKEKKELKVRIKEEDKRRLEKMGRNPESYKMIKIMSNLRNLFFDFGS